MNKETELMIALEKRAILDIEKDMNLLLASLKTNRENFFISERDETTATNLKVSRQMMMYYTIISKMLAFNNIFSMFQKQF